jgi:hypothetical protein
MLELEWGLNRARIWLGSLPEWRYQVATEREHHFAAPNTRDSHTKCAAIELLIPAGARSHYGGLGANFAPERNGDLEVRICASQESPQALKGSLADRLDKPYIGLATEYIEGVLKGIVDVGAPQLLGAGRLRICCGVYGVIGSSEWLFQLLGRIVTKLLALDDQHLAKETLIDLLQAELHKKPG